MPVTFRPYLGETRYTGDYLKVRDFLYRLNKDEPQAIGFPWGRWEWMIGHSCLDDRYLGRIGLWEECGKIVGLATYESGLGDGYFCLDKEHAFLKEEMLAYARQHLHDRGRFRAMIGDNDREFQHTARRMGFCPTQQKEHMAVISLHTGLAYSLPDGFSITSMAEQWDWHAYNRCLWRGFDHPGEPDISEEAIFERRRMLSGPGVNPALVVCVVSPQGRYVSHCGAWYLPGETYALVEPVATDPDFRRMGLGRAAVLEAVARCRKLGAAQALVGSSQQFYYSIGFDPVYAGTWWEYKG